MLKSAQKLFQPFKLGNMLVKNRFMRSATYDAAAGTTGLPKPLEMDILGKLATGGVGLIVPGFMYVQDDGKVLDRQLGMTQTAHAQAWEPIIKSLHEKDAKIICQLVHGGLACDRKLLKGKDLVGASATVPDSREMSIQEIEDLIQSYITAAIRLQNIDADGIQLHCSGDFLLAQFLHPELNQRKDKYGGSTENRLRIVKEIATELKNVVSPFFSVSIKIRTNPAGKPGTPLHETIEYLNMLKDDIDFAEVASDDILPLAHTIRQSVQGIPLAMTGNIRTIENMTDLITHNFTGIIGMSRPLIREPDLINKIKQQIQLTSQPNSANF